MPQYPYSAPAGLTYSNIVNAGTTVVKTHPGLLAGVTINSASTGATVEFFDNITATGTVIVGTLSVVSGTVLPAYVPFGGQNGVTLNTGLAVISTGTVNATIAYR